MKYPDKVFDEFVTMQRVADGASLSRFGDGELKMMCGQGYFREPPSLDIQVELRSIFNRPAEGCMVGIPTLDPRGPKFENWLRHKNRFESVIGRAGPWYSAFVTRPDSAPWIETLEYFDLVVSCWAGKKIVVVCEPTNKLLAILSYTASNFVHIKCESSRMYRRLRSMEREIISHRPKFVIISMGVSATCLANRLARRGIQALDFGSAGGMMVRLMQRKAA